MLRRLVAAVGAVAATAATLAGGPAAAVAHGDGPASRASDPLLLGLSIHVEGFRGENRDETLFDRHVTAIMDFAEIASANDAIVTFEFSETFMDGVIAWESTVIDDLKALGQATAVHADVGGQGDPTEEEMVEDLVRQRDKARDLGVDVRHVSGTCSRGPWVEAVIAAGYQSNNGPVEYCALSLDASVLPADWDLSGCTTPAVCHGALQVEDTLKVHPYLIDSSADFIIPKESGLVFMIGDSGSTAVCKAEESAGRCSGVGDDDDLPYIQDTLDSYLALREPGKVAALSMSWSIGTVPDADFVADYFAVYQPAIDAGEAVWMSNGDIGQAVLDSYAEDEEEGTGPSEPTDARSGTVTETTAVVKWKKPESNGGSKITAYQTRIKIKGASWSDWEDQDPDVTAGWYKKKWTRLKSGKDYVVRVRAVNAYGVAGDYVKVTFTTEG